MRLLLSARCGVCRFLPSASHRTPTISIDERSEACGEGDTAIGHMHARPRRAVGVERFGIFEASLVVVDELGDDRRQRLRVQDDLANLPRLPRHGSFEQQPKVGFREINSEVADIAM